MSFKQRALQFCQHRGFLALPGLTSRSGLLFIHKLEGLLTSSAVF